MKRISPFLDPARFALVMLIAAFSCGLALAQTQADPSRPPSSGGAPVASPVPAGSELSSAILEWTPPALAELSAQAVAKENFTFDRNMLVAAEGLMGDSDADVRQVVAKLDGVSVHMLRFADASSIDPAQIDAIRQAYHLRGWKHLVTTTGSGGPVHNGNTDIWLVMDGANVRGGAVLVESPKSLTLATVAGNLSPEDLLRLRGHFGIPRFDGEGLDTSKGK